MRLIASLCLLTTLTVILGACQTTSCPTLDAPPASAVDALKQANDPNVDAWVVGLSRHYQKLEVCN